MYVNIGNEDWAVCLDCGNDRECAAVRVAMTEALRAMELPRDEMGDVIEPSDQGAVRAVTPVDAAKRIVIEPKKELWFKPTVGMGMITSQKPVRYETPAPAALEELESEIRDDEERELAEFDDDDLGEPVLDDFSALVRSCDEEVNSKTEEKEMPKVEGARPCAFKGCPKFAYDENRYCSSRHSYKNKQAQPKTLAKKASKPADSSIQRIEIGGNRPGTAPALIDAVNKVDLARVSDVISGRVTVTMELSHAQIFRILEKLPPAKVADVAEFAFKALLDS